MEREARSHRPHSMHPVPFEALKLFYQYSCQYSYFVLLVCSQHEPQHSPTLLAKLFPYSSLFPCPCSFITLPLLLLLIVASHYFGPSQEPFLPIAFIVACLIRRDLHFLRLDCGLATLAVPTSPLPPDLWYLLLYTKRFDSSRLCNPSNYF